MENDDAITKAEWESLLAAVRAQHELAAKSRTVPQLLRAFCVCGHPTGPGTPACNVLRKILDAQAPA